ncbi:MAG: hypothetical protein SWJ54_06025, partial [Cyanobacteriota bacterium]|nr:hypothetical protein [Cyanobacteriota bacterium]
MITNNIFSKLTVASATAALVTIASQVPAQAASFNYSFPLINDDENVQGNGYASFEAEPITSTDWEKVAITDFEVNLTLDETNSFSFTTIEEANAVFFNGEFAGLEYRGASQESSEYVLLIDGGDEFIKPGEPGAWSVWGPNAETGEVDTRVTGGAYVDYDPKAVPEPGTVAGLVTF